MSDLITDAMVEIAHAVINREIGAECPTPSECAACDAHQATAAILEAVAPLIAAAALRDAARIVGDLHDPDTKLAPVAMILGDIRDMADELEANNG